MDKPAVARGFGWMLVVAVVMVFVSPVAVLASFSYADWWWGGPDVEVPRDGMSHTVTVDEPGAAYAIWSDRSLIDPTCVLRDDSGDEIPLRAVSPADRIFIDSLAVAEAEASFLFTAPENGVVEVSCELVEATPTQTLGLGSAPNRLVFGLLSWGTFLLGPTMLVAGLVIAAVAVARRGSAKDTVVPGSAIPARDARAAAAGPPAGTPGRGPRTPGASR